MRRRGGRSYIWRLALPVPLAALLVGAVFSGARRAWRSTPTTAPRLAVGERPTEPTAPRDAQQPAAPTADALRPTASSSIPPPPERTSAGGPVEPSRSPQPRPATPVGSHPRTFGPAPEPVAPPSTAALRTSEPPPAAVSAPQTAPAPSIGLVPGAEPVRAPRTSPPAVAQPQVPPAPAPARPSPQLREAWARESVRSVRFDAGYYYGQGRSARQLAEELTESWAEKGVNLIYFYAYNRVYGARYRTSYRGNIMEDYGRQDLLGHMLREAHKRGLKVVAWFYGPQHKQMWDQHPDWREKTAEGKDYRPTPDGYHLCPRNAEVAKWWLGFVDDVLASYPELDGVDIAEPQVDSWGDNACHCQHCRSQFAESHPGEKAGTAAWRRFRSEGLTRLLLATSRLVKSYQKESHLTTVFTAQKDGGLMSVAAIRDATGFDLEAILASQDRPDVIQAELIWQQWAATYRNRAVFNPEWTRQAVRQAKDLVRGRARLIAHLEVTDFGAGPLDGPQIGTTVAAAVEGAPYGVDIYDAHLLDKTEGAARHLQTAWLSF